jgi:hypothetical protein
MLARPSDTVPSQVSQRRPEVTSWSEIVGLGVRNLNGVMLMCCNYSGIFPLLYATEVGVSNIYSAVLGNAQAKSERRF